jgi:uracil-DNA glycosylase
MKAETKDKLGSWYTTYPTTFDKIDNIVKALDFKNICPAPQDILNCFYKCKYENLRVIFVGQDPYSTSFNFSFKNYLHANGLAFSVVHECQVLPPSLQKIEEQVLDQGYIFLDKTLESWAEQGVLLLNSSLTTEKNTPAVHINVWKPFIEELLKEVTINNPGLPIALIGKYAQGFESVLSSNSHIFKVEHPAAASYNNRTWNSDGIFLKINGILHKNNGETISW